MSSSTTSLSPFYNNNNNNDDDDTTNVEYVSYRSNAIFAESMLMFLNGAWWGTVWSCVTPFYPVGTLEYKREVATGIFRPAPPLACLRSIPSNALFFASIFATKSLATRSMELARGTTSTGTGTGSSDPWNDVFGIGAMLAHVKLVSGTDRRLLLHNRAVGSVLVMGLVYTNFFA